MRDSLSGSQMSGVSMSSSGVWGAAWIEVLCGRVKVCMPLGVNPLLMARKLTRKKAIVFIILDRSGLLVFI